MAFPPPGHDAGVYSQRTHRRSTADVFMQTGLILTLAACSAGSTGSGSTTTQQLPAGSSGSTSAAGGSVGQATGGGGMGPSLLIGGTATSDDGGSGGKDPAHMAVTTLPAGFHQTDIGGFKLGDRVMPGTAGMSAGGAGGSAGAGGGANGDCGNILLGVVRDFKGADEGGHPDFEASGVQGADITPGMVSATLGTDRKPVYASQCEIGHPGGMAVCPYGAQNTSKMAFDQWYHDTPGVNEPYLVSLWLAPQVGGLYTFQSLAYFPIDNAGFMGTTHEADDHMQHNFGFTTELHTQFLYRGGERFNFQGDDDVWVYINNKLAVDLGGLHPMQQRNVDLDAQAAALGITKGTIYPLDLFHAERHTTSSTFRIDTNLSFTDCGTVIRDVVK